MAETKFGYCTKCNEVFSYEQYADGETDIDRGEFLVHGMYMSAGYATKEQAQSALEVELQEEAEEADMMDKSASDEIHSEDANSIPENVIVALAKARERGAYNMFDRKGVIEYITAMISEEAGDWLADNKERYIDALNEMGEYISKPR